MSYSIVGHKIAILFVPVIAMPTIAGPDSRKQLSHDQVGR